jgi:hypothetical protein
MKTARISQIAAASIFPCCLMGFWGAQVSEAAAPTKSVPYSVVAPIIKAQCVSCHNANRHPEAVDLSTYAAVMKSGDHGPIVVAGFPGKSKLIAYVDGTKQPRMPMGKPPLSKANLALLKKWITAGAKK